MVTITLGAEVVKANLDFNDVVRPGDSRRSQSSVWEDQRPQPHARCADQPIGQAFIDDSGRHGRGVLQIAKRRDDRHARGPNSREETTDEAHDQGIELSLIHI